MPDYYYPNNSYYPQQRPYQQHQNGLLWVQGEEAAKAYMVAAGNSVLLMDSEKHSFYIKSTDQSGMPMPESSTTRRGPRSRRKRRRNTRHGKN